MANTYESIAFLTREEAQEPIKILEDQGEAAALEYLKQFHEPGEGTLVSTRENPWKDHDNVYEENVYGILRDVAHKQLEKFQAQFGDSPELARRLLEEDLARD